MEQLKKSVYWAGEQSAAQRVLSGAFRPHRENRGLKAFEVYDRLLQHEMRTGTEDTPASGNLRVFACERIMEYGEREKRKL